jgi:sarcosine oxidase subunit beta
MSRTLLTDVAIIGGGLVGSSAALALRRMGFSVALLDKGFCGAQASGVNYGGVRRQGRPPEQIALSQRAHAVWPRLKDFIGIDGEFVRSGHLKVARTEAEMASLETYAARVAEMGLDLELIGHNQLREHFPWIAGNVVRRGRTRQSASRFCNLRSCGPPGRRGGSRAYTRVPCREGA